MGALLACRERSRTEPPVKRVIVLGGLGLFGRTIVEQLRQLGIHRADGLAQARGRTARRRERSRVDSIGDAGPATS